MMDINFCSFTSLCLTKHQGSCTMSQMYTGNSAGSTDSNNSDDNNVDDLERLLVEGVTLDQPASSPPIPLPHGEVDDEDGEVLQGGDIQGAIGLYAEAAQD